MMDSYYHPALGGSTRYAYWMSGYDFNGDNLITIDEDTNNDSIIDLRDREVGALKIINGHPGFGYAGYAYLPYKFLPTEQMKEDYAYFCHAEIRELPEYEIKVAISYNSRKNLTLAYNYAQNANCITPPNNYYKLISSYVAKGGDSVFMQGINTEPLEIALNFGTDYPDADFGKIFFISQFLNTRMDFLFIKLSMIVFIFCPLHLFCFSN